MSYEESKHDAVWMHLMMYGGEVVSTAGDRKSAKNAPEIIQNPSEMIKARYALVRVL